MMNNDTTIYTCTASQEVVGVF